MGVAQDTDKNVFPLKIREPMIVEANNFLRKRGLFPEDNDDSDDYVFGEDDFPSMDDPVADAGSSPKVASPKSSPKKAASPKAASPKGSPKSKSKDKKGGHADNKKDGGAKPDLKKIIKEGGKKGVEIEGAADMGGMQFFNTVVDLCDGQLDLLEESMKAMNAESDPTEEERKGGSGSIGKMIFSAGEEQLAVLAYTPETKLDQICCEDWLKAVLSTQGGEVLSVTKTLCMGRVKTDKDKNVFPLK